MATIDEVDSKLMKYLSSFRLVSIALDSTAANDLSEVLGLEYLRTPLFDTDFPHERSSFCHLTHLGMPKKVLHLPLAALL